MKVILAGHNLDISVIAEARNKGVAPERLSPEVLSAAYARISRDPRPVDELRQAALDEVEKARASNRRIIFGMGHHSVAEHAVFNFDIIGLSRLAIESLEHFRLCSFTEKSQRYITLDHDYVTPAELDEPPFREALGELVTQQASVYAQLHAALLAHLEAEFPDMAQKKSTRNTLDGWAKEDARYATLLCTTGQLGMTTNARNLELMIKRLNAAPLQELRALARALYEPASQSAPSILLFTEPTPYDLSSAVSDAHPALQQLRTAPNPCDTEVALVHATKDADRRVAAALLAAQSGRSFEACWQVVSAMPDEALRGIFVDALQHMEFYDSVPRAFEHAQLTFDVVVSAACYGQLKRHRMMSQTPGPYCPSLGITLPPRVVELGLSEVFTAFADRAAALFETVQAVRPEAAPYALTNAHRRRVLLTMNLRDLYHFCRLREDAHAQWDIQHLAARMREAAEKVMPLGTLLLCGKDAYVARYTAVYGRKPAMDPAQPTLL
ncbi:MAG: FAD-dependent thymidylate synthase [Myxococcales bacterium]|nr:FAD-dependent thymidylate synthase [Myxococcales bacterium]